MPEKTDRSLLSTKSQLETSTASNITSTISKRLPKTATIGSIQHTFDTYVQTNLAEKVLNLPNSTGCRAYICESCLTIDIRPIGSKSSSYSHICNSLWLIDHPQLLQNKELVNQYLKNHFALFFAKALRERSKSEIKLVAFEHKKSLTYDPEELSLPPPSGADWLTLLICDSTNRELARIENTQDLDWIKPIDLGFPPENHWGKRAIKDGQTVLKDDELTDFLRIANNRTLAVFKMVVGLKEKFYIMKIDVF
jgi:hypothetical protein